MSAVSGVLVFLLGLTMGSFLNCLVYRLNEDKAGLKSLWGKSYCPNCKKQLLWYDNLPLISFIALKGKCRWCHSPIGWHYPVGELSTGALTLFVFYFSWLQSQIYDLRFLIYELIIMWALIAIFLSDLQYRTIPDQIIYPAIIISLIWLIANKQWLNAISGLGAAFFFFLLVFLTRFKGMGLGDVKLATLMGLFLGFPKTLVALYLAFLTGAVVGVILILVKKKRMKSQIAFGPFLVVATFLAWFWGEKIWQIFL